MAKTKDEPVSKFAKGQVVRLSPVGATMRAGDPRAEGVIITEQYPHQFVVRWPDGEDVLYHDGWLEAVS